MCEGSGRARADGRGNLLMSAMRCSCDQVSTLQTKQSNTGNPCVALLQLCRLPTVFVALLASLLPFSAVVFVRGQLFCDTTGMTYNNYEDAILEKSTTIRMIVKSVYADQKLSVENRDNFSAF